MIGSNGKLTGYGGGLPIKENVTCLGAPAKISALDNHEIVNDCATDKRECCRKSREPKVDGRLNESPAGTL